MKQILIVNASHNRNPTGSRHIAGEIEHRLRSKYPDAKFVHRDLAESPPPHLSGKTLQSFFTPGDQRDPELQSAVKLSDELTDELLHSELLVLATPMWNFGVPSSVKAWIDHVMRAGRTFSYSAAGGKGLVPNTRAILVMSSGSVLSSEAMRAWDYVGPYLKHLLGFMGIKDVQIVRVEGTSMPENKEQAVRNAEKAVAELSL